MAKNRRFYPDSCGDRRGQGGGHGALLPSLIFIMAIAAFSLAWREQNDAADLEHLLILSRKTPIATITSAPKSGGAAWVLARTIKEDSRAFLPDLNQDAVWSEYSRESPSFIGYKSLNAKTLPAKLVDSTGEAVLPPKTLLYVRRELVKDFYDYHYLSAGKEVWSLASFSGGIVFHHSIGYVYMSDMEPRNLEKAIETEVGKTRKNSYFALILAVIFLVLSVVSGHYLID